MSLPHPDSELDLLICSACSTQFDTADRAARTTCHICDDPRQYIPPTGQAFTTLRNLLTAPERHKNTFTPDKDDPNVIAIHTQPRVPIGQRAFLLRTPVGNILWDLVAYLDQDTIDKINELGGLAAIVISHPHYYVTHLTWSRTFGCPVYTAAADEQWLARTPTPPAVRRTFSEPTLDILPGSGVTIIRCGGHFPGSLVAHWKDKLFVADTLFIVPSALYDINRPPGTASFAFMWSIPNYIPLPPKDIVQIWESLKAYEFSATFGAFPGQEIRRNAKRKLLDSAKIAIRAMGYEDHAFLAVE